MVGRGLMASHFQAPARARSEASQFFGTPVQHLGEAAEVLATRPSFLPCQAQHVMVDLLGLREDFAWSEDHLAGFVDAARARRYLDDPTLSDLVFGVLPLPG